MSPSFVTYLKSLQKQIEMKLRWGFISHVSLMHEHTLLRKSLRLCGDGHAKHDSSSRIWGQTVQDNVLKHLQQCYSRWRRDTIQSLQNQLTLNCVISKHHVLNSHTLGNSLFETVSADHPLPHTRYLLLQTIMPEQNFHVCSTNAHYIIQWSHIIPTNIHTISETKKLIDGDSNSWRVCDAQSPNRHEFPQRWINFISFAIQLTPILAQSM